MSSSLQLGSRISMKTFQLINIKGTVKYMGPVEGLAGDQLGIHLDQAKGKNDGSHGGKKYFDCPPGYGVFATYTQVKVLNEPLVDVSQSQEDKQEFKQAEGGVKSVSFGAAINIETKEESKEETKAAPKGIVKPSPRGSLRAPTGLKLPSSRGATPQRDDPKATGTASIAGLESSPSKKEIEIKTPRTGAGKGKGVMKVPPGEKKELKKIPGSQIKRGTEGSKKEEKTLGKPPLQKSKIQASRFNKPGGVGLKKSPQQRSAKTLTRKDSSKASLGLGTSFEYDEGDVASSRPETPSVTNEEDIKEEELEPMATLSGQRFEQLMAKEEEAKNLQNKIEELEGVVKSMKEEKIKEVAKAKSEVQSKEKAIEALKEQHKKEVIILKEEMAAKVEDAKSTKHEEVLAGKEKENESLKGKIQLLEEDKQQMSKEIKGMKDEIEELKVQVEIEKEEKELLKLQADQAQQSALSEETGPMNEQQLQAENQKLKIALRQVSGQLEIDKATRAQEIVELRDELERAKGLKVLLAEKDQDVNLLLEELEEKETLINEKNEEIKGLQSAIDQNSDLDLMVEELTNTILEKEDEIEKLKEDMGKVKEELEIEEEATNEAEKLAEILQGEVDAKLLDLQRSNREAKKFQEQIGELEKMIGKFRERVADLSDQKRTLSEQLAGSAEEEMSSKIDQLIENQSVMAQKLREAFRKELWLRQSQIQQNQNRAKTDWLLSFLPGKLLEQARVDSFQKVQLLETLKAKTYLLLREIAESSFMRATPGEKEAALVEEIDIHHFFRWVCELYYNVATLLDVLLRMGFVMLNIEVQNYHQICGLDGWGDLMAAGYFVDTLLHRIKEENLSPQASNLSAFNSTINAIQDFYFKSFAPAVSNSQILSPPKLASRQGLVLINLAILAVARTTALDQNMAIHRPRAFNLLNYIDIVIHKIDKIPENDSGSTFILNELELGKKLESKFEFAQVLWREKSDDPSDNENAMKALQTYDWVAWLEAVEKDISSLDRSTYFKKIDEFPDDFKDFCQAFLQKQIGEGPWNDMAETIKAELEKAAQQAEQIRELGSNLTEIKGKASMLERELRDAGLIKEGLERKLAEQSQRALRVPALEDDNRRLNEAVSKYQQSLSECKSLIEQLNEEKSNLEKKTQQTAAAAGPSRGPALPSLSRLQSMGGGGVNKMKNRFDFNQRVLLGDRLSSSYKEIFKKLMVENAEARTKKSLTLLRKLNENPGSAFNRYMAQKRDEEFLGFLGRKQTEFNEVICKLKEKEGCVRVMDLSKPQENTLLALKNRDQEKLSLLMRAKQYSYQFTQAVKKRHPKVLDEAAQQQLMEEAVH